jgi:hypothetical protein
MKTLLNLKLAVITILGLSTQSLVAQTVNIDYDVVSNNATQMVIKSTINNTSPMGNSLKVSAFNNVLTLTTGTVPTPTVMWAEAATFVPLNNPTAGVSSSPTRYRATQTPIGTGEPGAILLPTTPTEFGTMTINAGSAITYPVTLTPTSTGNPTVQMVNYYNGATNSNTITLAAGTITLTEPTIPLTFLPIKIIDIKAFKRGSNNSVQWVTATEYNNDVQIVERSLDGLGDWVEVGRVKGTNKLSENSYEVLDKKPAPLSYYRVRSVDFDGYEQLSSVVSVNRSGKGLASFSRVYPIPAVNEINVDVEAEEGEFMNVKFTDVKGQVAQLQIHQYPAGSSTQKIDISALAAGSYIMEIKTKGVLTTKTIVKQ